MASKSTPTKKAAKKSAVASLPKRVPPAKAWSAPVKSPGSKKAPRPTPQPAVTKPPASRAVATPRVLDPIPAETITQVVVDEALPGTAAAFPASQPPKTVPLTVSIQTSQGHAANGNAQPANILVIVTCAGWPVTELDKNHFTLMEHFDVPGQEAPFSNCISTFRNAGTGAYLLQTRPSSGAVWRSGHHLGQLLVSNSEDQQGQAGFKIIIR